jgi:multidrug transporter EmrE-like cation transporter
MVPDVHPKPDELESIVVYAFVSVLLNAFAQIALKKSTSLNSATLIELLKNPYLYLTGVFYLTSILTWFLALSRIPLSLGYPLQAVGYLIVTGGAVLLFKEQVNIVNWLGLAVILIGVILTQAGR